MLNSSGILINPMQVAGIVEAYFQGCKLDDVIITNFT